MPTWQSHFVTFANLATVCSDEFIVVPAILALIKGGEMRVRRGIMQTLARFGSKSKAGLPGLYEHLSDPPEVRGKEWSRGMVAQTKL